VIVKAYEGFRELLAADILPVLVRSLHARDNPLRGEATETLPQTEAPEFLFRFEAKNGSVNGCARAEDNPAQHLDALRFRMGCVGPGAR
jgi:hypothetical protein